MQPKMIKEVMISWRKNELPHHANYSLERDDEKALMLVGPLRKLHGK